MTLDKYLKRAGITSQQFAIKLKASISSVNKWRAGYRLPRPAAIERIAKMTKNRVKPSDWY